MVIRKRDAVDHVCIATFSKIPHCAFSGLNDQVRLRTKRRLYADGVERLDGSFR
jgi:hypothetical protein